MIKPVQVTNAQTGKTSVEMRDMPDYTVTPDKKPIDLEKLVTKLIGKGQIANRKEVEAD